jgi:hypothetical protein
MARINLVDYQIQIDFGRWSNAHLKVRADEQTILSLSFDHLARRRGMWSHLNGTPDRVCNRYEDGRESAPGDVRDLPQDHAAAASAREKAVEERAGTVLGVQLLGAKVDGVHDERHDERMDGSPEEAIARDSARTNHLLAESVVS